MSKHRNTGKPGVRKTTKKSVRKVKKKKINRKKLTLIICIVIALVFIIGKVTSATSKLINDMKQAKAQEIQKQKEIEEKKQFDLNSESQNPLEAKYTVVVDPGSGGSDLGNKATQTTSENGQKQVYEKDLSLEIAKKVASVLSNQKDVQVILTRTEDKTLSTQERTKLANSQNADAFVSIHMNAESSGNTANGVETYYRYSQDQTDKSKQLATSIQNTMKAYVTMKDRGVKQQNIKVLEETYMPSALVECGFITNKVELDKLLDNTYQNRLAEGIAQGVLAYLDKSGKK